MSYASHTKLGEAIEVLNERTEAIGLDPGLTDGEPSKIGELGDSTTRLFLSGFDLDLGELAAAARQFEEGSERMGELRNDAFDIWLHGLLVGLIAAKRQSKADQFGP